MGELMSITEKLEKGKETVALLIQNNCSPSAQYRHITAKVVYLKSDVPQESDHGYYENYYNEKHHYKGLQVRAQMSCGTTSPYGYNLSVLSHKDEIDLQEAEEIVKTIKPLRKKLEKIEQEEGYCLDYLEYMVRVVRILKVKAFIYVDAKTGRRVNRNMAYFRDFLKKMITENEELLNEIRQV